MRHLRPYRRDLLLGQAAEQRRLEQARRDRHHPDLQPGQVPGDRQGHADDAALGRGVGGLADLAVERRDRRGVHDDAPLAVFLGGLAHPERGQPDRVERPDEVDLDDPGEGVQRERAVLARGPRGVADARAVDQDAGRPVGEGLRRVERRRHVIRAGHVASRERGPGTEFLRHRRAVRAGQVEDDHRRAGVVQPPDGGQSEPGRTAGDQGHASRDFHRASCRSCPARSSGPDLQGQTFRAGRSREQVDDRTALQVFAQQSLPSRFHVRAPVPFGAVPSRLSTSSTSFS